MTSWDLCVLDNATTAKRSLGVRFGQAPRGNLPRVIDLDHVAIVSNMNAESPALSLLIAEEAAPWLPLSHRSATDLSYETPRRTESCTEMIFQGQEIKNLPRARPVALPMPASAPAGAPSKTVFCRFAPPQSEKSNRAPTQRSKYPTACGPGMACGNIWPITDARRLIKKGQFGWRLQHSMFA
jgi:hypothetical protein